MSAVMTTKVFVHGNPETAAIWEPLVSILTARGAGEVVLLSPPGFGAPTPAGWGATRAEYTRWLADELRSIGGAVDLVGHDWGAGHVYGVLADHPGLVRTWAADCAGLLHPDYEWHDAAKGWQTPGVGEEAVEGLVSIDEESFAAVFGALGMSDPVARAVKRGVDAEMARCILALYRDAAQPAMVHLGARFAAASPDRGLVIVAENDQYAGAHGTHAEVAGWVGASVVRIADAGHWWMCEKPEEAAAILLGHWATAD